MYIPRKSEEKNMKNHRANLSLQGAALTSLYSEQHQ